jgi:hypothetical protein
MRRADNLTTFMCRLSRNSGASTFWNPKGLSRPVAGKLYLYLTDLIGEWRDLGADPVTVAKIKFSLPARKRIPMSPAF